MLGLAEASGESCPRGKITSSYLLFIYIIYHSHAQLVNHTSSDTFSAV